MSDGDSSDGGETKRLLRKLFGNGRKSKWDIPNKYLTDSDDDDDVIVGGGGGEGEGGGNDIDSDQDDEHHRQAPASPSAAARAKHDAAIDKVQNDPVFKAAAQSTAEVYDEAAMQRHLNEVIAKRYQQRPDASETEIEAEKQWMLNQMRQQVDAEERKWADKLNLTTVPARALKDEIPDRFKQYATPSNLYEAAKSRPHGSDPDMIDRLNKLFMSPSDKMALAPLSQPTAASSLQAQPSHEDEKEANEHARAAIRTVRREQILKGSLGKYMREVDQIVHSIDSSSKIDRKVQKLAAQFTDKHLGKLYMQNTLQDNQTTEDWGSFQQQAYKFFDDRKAEALREKNIETAPFIKQESDSDKDEQFRTPFKSAQRSRTSRGSSVQGHRVSELVHTPLISTPPTTPPRTRSSTAVGSSSQHVEKSQVEESGSEQSGSESDDDESGGEDEPEEDEPEEDEPEEDLAEVMVRSRVLLKDSKHNKLSSKQKAEILNDFLTAIENKHGRDETLVPGFQLRSNGTIQRGAGKLSYFEATRRLKGKIDELNKKASKRSRRG